MDHSSISSVNYLNTTAYHNTSGTDGHLAIGYGYLGVAVSAIGFGTNYLPVKKFETGDGMFFQWIISNAIFLGSFIMGGIFKFPKFEPLVMLGGFIWSTGNVCVVPIIRLIGLGLGLLLWSSSNLIVGWASARFGWFGIIPQLPNNFALNYAGFALTAISPFIYSLVKTETVEEIIIITDETLESDVVLPFSKGINTLVNDYAPTKSSNKFQSMKPKLIAIGLSIFSGTMYGLMFIPVTYVKNRYPNSSQDDIDYIFAQCCGIYLGSSIYFLIYCVAKRNKPSLHAECILPGVCSGIIWFIAYIGFFYANQALSPAISQPIIAALPGLISIVINTTIFKEVRGIKNYILIGVAILITVVGVILTGLSKAL